MPGPAAPRQERRKHRRFVEPPNVRIWLVTGEFEEIYTTVNFARRLLNLGEGGVLVETTGRLRPEVKMSVELRFDDFNGTMRSEARIVWADTQAEGGQEVHLAGLKFVGTPEITAAVRAFFRGENPKRIAAQRQAEFKDLKRKSEARRDGVAGSRGGGLRKVVAILLMLSLGYLASFWGFVLLGRTEGAGLRYRYLGGGSAEAAVAKAYAPAHWLFQKLGIPLVHDP